MQTVSIAPATLPHPIRWKSLRTQPQSSTTVHRASLRINLDMRQHRISLTLLLTRRCRFATRNGWPHGSRDLQRLGATVHRDPDTDLVTINEEVHVRFRTVRCCRSASTEYRWLFRLEISLSWRECGHTTTPSWTISSCRVSRTCRVSCIAELVRALSTSIGSPTSQFWRLLFDGPDWPGLKPKRS